MSQNVNNSLIVKTLINLQNKVDELSNKLDNIPTGLTTQNADNLGLKILIDIRVSIEIIGSTIDANNKILISTFKENETIIKLYTINIIGSNFQYAEKQYNTTINNTDISNCPIYSITYAFQKYFGFIELNDEHYMLIGTEINNKISWDLLYGLGGTNIDNVTYIQTFTYKNAFCFICSGVLYKYTIHDQQLETTDAFVANIYCGEYENNIVICSDHEAILYDGEEILKRLTIPDRTRNISYAKLYNGSVFVSYEASTSHEMMIFYTTDFENWNNYKNEVNETNYIANNFFIMNNSLYALGSSCPLTKLKPYYATTTNITLTIGLMDTGFNILNIDNNIAIIPSAHGNVIIVPTNYNSQ
mgnify:CR=1 FL=1